MQSKRVWARVFGVETGVVIEHVDVDEDAGEIVVGCRLRKSARRRCGRYQKRCPGYDNGEGRRRWRALDAGTIKVFIEVDAPRVSCQEHGVTVAAVPWARHDTGHTRAFDDQVAWLVTHTSKTAVVELMRIAWRTVGAIAGRVVDDARAVRDPFDGLERIGIDEISFRRGHKYLMVVVDHDTGRLVWVAEGHDRKTLQTFFDLLGPERCAKIRLVSADAAEWIAACALDACEHATLCLDPFHIVRWATQALDVVRRWVWNVLRKIGVHGQAAQLKGCRYALWKNPEDLTDRQQAKLAWIARHNHSLYRAYLLKEQLRLVFQHRGDTAVAMLGSSRGFVIDLSGCGSDDRTLRFAMLAGMRAIDQLVVNNTGQTLVVNDESWRLAGNVDTVRWMQHSFKLGRQRGQGSILVLHRLAELGRQTDGATGEIASRLVSDADTHILFRQDDTTDAHDTVTRLGLPAAATELLANLPPYRALVHVRGRLALLDVILSDRMKTISDTNTAIRD